MQLKIVCRQFSLKMKFKHCSFGQALCSDSGRLSTVNYDYIVKLWIHRSINSFVRVVEFWWDSLADTNKWNCTRLDSSSMMNRKRIKILHTIEQLNCAMIAAGNSACTLTKQSIVWVECESRVSSFERNYWTREVSIATSSSHPNMQIQVSIKANKCLLLLLLWCVERRVWKNKDFKR